MEKYALVLEGGGMRGAYTMGALAWLNDNGITFDYGAGISSGAVGLVCYMEKNKKTPYNMVVKYACNGENVGYLPKLSEFKEFCKDRSPKEIAKSLVRVLKLGKLYEKTENKFSNIRKNMTSVKMTLFKLKTGQLTKNPKVQYNIYNKLKGRLAKINEQTFSTLRSLFLTEKKIVGNDALLNKMEQTNFLHDINMNGQIPS